MANVGEVVYDAKIDTKGLRQDAHKVENIVKDSADKSEGHMSGFAGRMGRVVATGFAAAGAAMAIGFGMAIKATASLEQNIGGTEAVFGEFAKNVQKMAVDSSKIMGTSANDYMQTINRMGSLMRGAGLDSKTAMDLSAQSMQRAADVASVMGIDVGFAMDSIAGAAKGNFTMMDNLGVKMDATSIAAYGLAKGITKSYDEMSQGEKVQLAMQMFLEQTAFMAGNYAKENKTLAGSFTTLKAEFENFLGGVDGSGARLAQAMIQMGVVLGQKLPEIARSLATELQGALRVAFASINWNDLYKTILPSEELRNSIGTIASALTNFFSMLWSVVKPMVDWFTAVMLPVLQQMAIFIGDQLRSAWDSISESMRTMWPLWQAIGIVIGVVVAGAIIVLVGGIALLLGIGAMLINWIMQAMNWFVQLWASIYNGITQVIGFFQNLWNNIVSGFNSAKSGVQNAWNGIPAWFGGIVNGIIGAISGIPSAIGNAFRGAYTQATSAFANLPSYFYGLVGQMASAGAAIIQGLVSGMNPAPVVAKVQGIANDAIAGIKSSLGIKSPSKVFAGIGGNIMAGLEQGIDRGSVSAVNSMLRASDSVTGAFGGGVNSPTVNGAYTGSGGGTTKTTTIGSIYLANDVDADRFLRRLDENQEAISSGLVPNRSYA